jgi:RNA polymerase sigma-70 factor, ECF subfamily
MHSQFSNRAPDCGKPTSTMDAIAKQRFDVRGTSGGIEADLRGGPSGLGHCDSIAYSPLSVARRQAFEAARSAWPAIELPFEEFSAHLDALGYTRDLPHHVNAVYLCKACARGLGPAVRTLEAQYFPPLAKLFGRARTDGVGVDEILQSVRVRLLVGSHARIAMYRGAGPLDGWLRAIALNVLRDSSRARLRLRRECLAPDEQVLVRWCEATGSDTDSPESITAAQQTDGLLNAMLVGAIRRLACDQRRLLHWYFVTGLSIDQLGALRGVHRSSAARQIQRSLRDVEMNVRRQLLSRLGPLSTSDMNDLFLTMSRSTLDLVDVLHSDDPIEHDGRCCSPTLNEVQPRPTR